ncbi:unnamed protein product [Anisakis simplex]|uniref:Uncharacterized protein n=1 Tax=Anisakis simplex TaxID=6269 RepID=A0A0M3J0I3_ANISI|nr:unnamed protein product [Anisakis simplex]
MSKDYKRLLSIVLLSLITASHSFLFGGGNPMGCTQTNCWPFGSSTGSAGSSGGLCPNGYGSGCDTNPIPTWPGSTGCADGGMNCQNGFMNDNNYQNTMNGAYQNTMNGPYQGVMPNPCSNDQFGTNCNYPPAPINPCNNNNNNGGGGANIWCSLLPYDQLGYQTQSNNMNPSMQVLAGNGIPQQQISPSLCNGLNCNPYQNMPSPYQTSPFMQSLTGQNNAMFSTNSFQMDPCYGMNGCNFGSSALPSSSAYSSPQVGSGYLNMNPISSGFSRSPGLSRASAGYQVAGVPSRHTHNYPPPVILIQQSPNAPTAAGEKLLKLKPSFYSANFVRFGGFSIGFLRRSE